MLDQLRTTARRHPIAGYYALAFTISFGAITLVVGPGGMFGTADTIVVAGIVGLTGPSVAGLLMTGLVDGRAGYAELRRRLLAWRVGARWYLVALCLGPAVMAGVLLGLSALSSSFVPAIATADDRLGLLVRAVAAGLFVASFEELGWTGFATPHLLARHGALATGVLMGVLWGIWHFPFFSGTSDPAGFVPQPVLVTVLLFGWLVPYRVLMVWAYNSTRSGLVAILMHASVVACMYVLATNVTGAGRIASVGGMGLAFWLIAAVVFRVGRSRRDVHRASTRGSAAVTPRNRVSPVRGSSPP
jgi:membrane protease YdiL (CAAX protease family)